MRFWISGPRFFGFRPGVSFPAGGASPAQTTQRSAGNSIEGSFLYVVRGDHNLTKIGVTTNPRARLAQLRTGSAFPIDYAFLGVTPGSGYEIEKAAHALLDARRVNGEWFDVTPEYAISALMGAAGKLNQPVKLIDLATADATLRIAAGNDPAPPRPVGFMGALAVTGNALVISFGLFFLWAIALFRFGSFGPDWIPAIFPVIGFAAAYLLKR